MEKMRFMPVVALAIMSWALSAVSAQHRVEAGKVDLRLVKTEQSVMGEGYSAFSLPEHFVWCGSTIRSEEDGKYYLFYSAFESGDERPVFNEGWVLGSKIGVAVSDSPYGGFRNLGWAYNKDGFEPDSISWDGQSVGNTHLKRYNGRYYLYYCGTTRPKSDSYIKGKLSLRDRVQQNYKLGVICFNTIQDFLDGNYTCNEQPILSPRTRVKADNVLLPSPEGTQAKPDNLIVVNPSVVYRPSDNKYLLYFKGNLYDPTWRGIHGVAISDSPEGPFVAQDFPVLEFNTEDGRKLNAEDPFVWYHRGDKCFYAVFKDFTGAFTKGEPGLALMTSEDGISWQLPERSLFMEKKLQLKDGTSVEVNRLERPQLLLNENDDPIVMYAACAVGPVNGKKDGSSFNVQIPIVWK